MRRATWEAVWPCLRVAISAIGRFERSSVRFPGACGGHRRLIDTFLA